MGDRSVRNIPIAEKQMVEQFSNSLHSVALFAHNVQSSLDDIKDNTKRLFWWSSTLVCICLGLFLLAQLVRLRDEMRRMVQYQEVFQRMWEEDKMIEQEKIEEERRERRIEAQRRTAAARRNKSRGPTGPIRAPTASSYGRRTDDEDFPTTSAYRPTRRPGASPFGPEVDDALDTMPPSGPQRDEWIRTLASMTQEQRQANYQRVDDEDDEEEYWGGPT